MGTQENGFTYSYLAMLLKYMLSEGMHLSGVYFKSALLSILSVGGKSLFMLSALFLLGSSHWRLHVKREN